MVLLIAIIMAIAFGTVWYFTQYQDTAIERYMSIFLRWIEGGFDRSADAFYSVKNRLVTKTEL